MITPAYGLTATERVLPNFVLDWTTGFAQNAVDVTRTGVATFVGANGLIQSAAENTQRIDYITGVAGLLVEESRTNLFVRSSDLSASPWSVSGATAELTAVKAPDDSNETYLLKEDGNNTSHSASRNQTLISSTTYTYSIFAKPNGRNIYLRLDRTGSSATNIIVNFDLANGTVGSVSSGGTATYIAAGIKPYANGFYRCWITGSLGAFTDGRARVFLLDGTTVSYQGDGTSGVYIWGAQLEAGAFPTSYIPTEASAVTRNADVATVTGTNFSDWYNEAEGSIYTEGIQYNTSFVDNTFICVDDGTTGQANQVAFRVLTSGTSYYVTTRTAASQVSSLTLGTTAAGTVAGVAHGYKLNSFVGAINGAAVKTDGGGAVPPSQTRLRIGTRGDGSQINSALLRKILYWPQRLTNAEIQAFSKQG